MLRMSSYMSRGQKLIEAGKTPDAMRLVTRGFQHYAERVLNSPMRKQTLVCWC